MRNIKETNIIKNTAIPVYNKNSTAYVHNNIK